MHILIINGGPAPNPAALQHIGVYDKAIAVDSGYEHALALGLGPDTLIGDMDSIDSEVLASAKAEVGNFISHPADKDQTDLELALAEAVRQGADTISVLGSDGGSLDCLLGSILVLANESLANVRITAYYGSSRLQIVRDELRFSGAAGQPVAIFAIGGEAEISIQGLKYETDQLLLKPSVAHAGSNQFLGGEAKVTVYSGMVIVIEAEFLG